MKLCFGGMALSHVADNDNFIVDGESAMEQLHRENRSLQREVTVQRKTIEVLQRRLRELAEESKKQIEQLRAELAQKQKENVELQVVAMKACEDIAAATRAELFAAQSAVYMSHWRLYQPH